MKYIYFCTLNALGISFSALMIFFDVDFFKVVFGLDVTWIIFSITITPPHSTQWNILQALTAIQPPSCLTVIYFQSTYTRTTLLLSYVGRTLVCPVKNEH